MPTPNPFSANAFSLQSLTAAINNAPRVPSQIAAMGLFEERGVSTLMMSVDERAGVLTLAPIRPRGAPGGIVTGDSRKAIPFNVPHIPVADRLLADEVQDVRLFGSETQAEGFQVALNDKLALMRRAIDYTMEVHRVNAIKGSYYDSNGDLVSLFSTFSVSQQTQALGLHSTNRSQIRQKMSTVMGYVRSALGATPYTGLHVLCSQTFWNALIDDKDTRDTYLNQAQAQELRGDPNQRFSAFGATWELYEGTTDATFGSDAYAIPLGVPGLCITRFAPANYVETVNTLGLPYYAKGEPLPLGKGYDLEAQSNPINLVTRPAAVIKLTVS